MAAIATPIYIGWEGNKTLPYKDIVGVWTVCAGDTRNVKPGVRLTEAQCRERTAKILQEFGTEVAKSSPGIENHWVEWASHSIHAANIGMGNYNKGSVRKLYNQGNYRLACRAMLLYDKAGGKTVIGLKNRRAGTNDRIGEYELCLGGAIPRELKFDVSYKQGS